MKRIELEQLVSLAERADEPEWCRAFPDWFATEAEGREMKRARALPPETRESHY
jgi:hypothetical protein